MSCDATAYASGAYSLWHSESSIRSARSAGSKQDRVREYVTEHAPQIFRIADIRTALLGISDRTIRLVLDELKRDGRIRPEGTGRAAVWVRTSR
ncbi:hypothetical protein [Nocardioides sp.]|uniref:hypothetical protein n=1 Tax=Nocardioides sp. TaxID=35761 RepID=UPI002B8EADCB|nr:hypothetical protein [Nocardioides sp.]HXH80063.1 hypothetical protein [Nocardioides sp.]